MQGLFIAFCMLHTLGVFVCVMTGATYMFQESYSERTRKERIQGKKMLKYALVWELLAVPQIIKKWGEVTQDEEALELEEQQRTMREARRIISRMEEDERREWERQFRAK